MGLNKDQQKAVELVKSGANVCIVGAGGTGKSFLINYLSSQEGVGTVVTATTGTAAVNIGGMTFASAFSIPIGFHTKQDFKSVYRKTSSIFRGDKVDRIIIDESSMITPSGFHVFSKRLKKWNNRRKKKNLKPIQVILVMDLMQLPAILQDREKILTKESFGTLKFYKTKDFLAADFKVVHLTESMRQSDKEFKGVLDKLRFGEDIDEVLKWLNDKCYHKKLPNDCTILATTNKAVDNYNQKVFNSNQNPTGLYRAKIVGDFRVKDSLVPEKLYLKVGLRVMTIKNAKTEGGEDPLYVNGSTGIVTMLTGEGVWVKMDHSGEDVYVEPSVWESFGYGVNGDTQELYKYVEGSFEQIPLKQCASITIHKAQGAEFYKYLLDPSGGMGWSPALCYVACSRALTPDSIYLKRKLTKKDISTDTEAREWLKTNVTID